MAGFKKVIRNILIIARNILVYAASIIIRSILIPISIIYAIIKLFVESHFDRAFVYIGDMFLSMAKSVDKFGNVVCAPLFNDTLILKSSEHKFGLADETISEVIGYNLLSETLSKTGMILNDILNFIDKDHTINAAKNKINNKKAE